MKNILLEICVDSFASAVAAEAGGADRIELCAAIGLGGVTPSPGLIGSVCARLRIPVHVLVRPRPGGFRYTSDELAIVRKDILAAKELGAAGVVVGVLNARGSVNVPAMARLIRAARPMKVTFHRAFDSVAGRVGGRCAALRTLVDLGVDRVLTTGGPPMALEGRRRLRELVELSGGRIAVMAGGGLTRSGVARILRETGVGEVHVGSAVATFRRSGTGPFLVREGVVDPAKVEAFVRLIRRSR